jgi:hypothetical protein
MRLLPLAALRRDREEVSPGFTYTVNILYMKNNFVIQRAVHKVVENQAKSQEEQPYEV